MEGKVRGLSRSRITIVETVYYEEPGKPTVSTDSRFSYHVEHPEDPFERRIRISKVDEIQSLVPGCWIKYPGLIVVKNTGKTRLCIALKWAEWMSEEQSRVIWPAFPPNTSLRLPIEDPITIQDWVVTSPEGDGEYVVTVYPR